jgi:hypothetical protein
MNHARGGIVAHVRRANACVKSADAREGTLARARRVGHWEPSSASRVRFPGPWHCPITDRYLWPLTRRTRLLGRVRCGGWRWRAARLRDWHSRHLPDTRISSWPLAHSTLLVVTNRHSAPSGAARLRRAIRQRARARTTHACPAPSPDQPTRPQRRGGRHHCDHARGASRPTANLSALQRCSSRISNRQSSVFPAQRHPSRRLRTQSP